MAPARSLSLMKALTDSFMTDDRKQFLRSNIIGNLASEREVEKWNEIQYGA